jgi:NADH:ubiquinone oxidoreductase subunit 6 (subunit J)/ferredoxin
VTGETLCIACDLCAEICPEDLIVVGSQRDPESRKKVLTHYTFDTSRCLFCGLCQEVCPTNAIELTQDFELASYDRRDMVWDRKRLEQGWDRIDNRQAPRGEDLSTVSCQLLAVSCQSFAMEATFFYILAAMLVAFAILTVTAANPVRSAVYLISALLCMAGLFFLLEAEFVGAVQILVYVGGIMVLFLFVIMLVSVREMEGQRKANRQWKTALVLGVVLSCELVFLVVRGADVFRIDTVAQGLIEQPTFNTESVGALLYGTYLLPFEIASILLLVAMIAAVVLTQKQL